MALEYNLKFLPSRHFTGKMDVQVISKIKEYIQLNKQAGDDYQLSNRYFVLAPPSAFKLVSTEAYRTPKRIPDPVIFHQVDDNHYRMIHKWGADFTIFRAISGYKWKSYWNFVSFWTAINFMFVALFLATVTNSQFRIESPFLFFGIATLVSFVLSIVYASRFVDNCRVMQEFFTPHGWNRNEKYR